MVIASDRMVVRGTMLRKKIILLDGSNMMRDLFTRAIEKRGDLKVIREVHDSADLEKWMDERSSLDADWMLILQPADVTSSVIQRAIARYPGIKAMTVVTDGSNVSYHWYEERHETIAQATLPALLEILHT